MKIIKRRIDEFVHHEKITLCSWKYYSLNFLSFLLINEVLCVCVWNDRRRKNTFVLYILCKWTITTTTTIKSLWPQPTLNLKSKIIAHNSACVIYDASILVALKLAT